MSCIVGYLNKACMHAWREQATYVRISCVRVYLFGCCLITTVLYNATVTGTYMIQLLVANHYIYY
jgi:hypothetical protein